MKKTYQIPEIEVTQMESTELLEGSMSVYSDKVGASSILSREDDTLFFEDED